MSNEKLDSPTLPGVGSLEEIEKRHSEGPGGGTDGRGRPPLPSTGDPLLDRKRERDRARYAAKKGRPYVAPASGGYSEPVQQLFTADSCRALVGLPFTLAAAYTKSEAWNLEEGEESALASPCASTLNEFFPQASPKWAALTAFCLAMASIVGKKYLIFKEETRKNAEAESVKN
jgi:hypothetical protein